MARALVDLLWRDHPMAPGRGARGPRAKATTDAVVEAAIALADRDGIDAVTMRALAAAAGVTGTAVYTHVPSRDDLLVLMVDAVRANRSHPSLAGATWRDRVRALAEHHRAEHLAHPWLLDVDDQRSAIGPGTIAAYDHDLHAFDDLGLDDVARDAALAFVIDAARASARALRAERTAADAGATWAASAERLAAYVGDAHPLARRVGAAAGAQMGAPASAEHAWAFALARVIDGLAALVDPA
ncbi:TetR/AcrR family transcriptional regulator [Agrococcus sp. SGAir0287]|uniref:TetR/AcrR family transcriptional regulator n=1 Tax=Agrococcus sp. SGAir0287 TaxID=2070347 RepID=UPI0010CD50D9|nr:TetR family transcriptional regulator [Agrococcus sp. SGAir0287]QCR18984.1 TetR family transcriptional regulator [Agrococcus sp. SGAir0287]